MGEINANIARTPLQNRNSSRKYKIAMRLFVPPLEIGDHEGFSRSKDLFGRAEHGKRLTNLLATKATHSRSLSMLSGVQAKRHF